MKNQTPSEMKATILALHKELNGRGWFENDRTREIVKQMSLLFKDWHFANGEDYEQTDALRERLGL